MKRKFEKISPLELAVLLLTVLFAAGTILWFLLAGPRQGAAVVEKDKTSQGELPQAEAPGILPGERININTASISDLTRLPGIGESRAADIAAWREENGGFAAIEDLMQVSGIGEGIFEGVKDYITVVAPTEGGESHGEDTGS